jgi:small subunit ribosomal protein S21
MLHVDVRGDTEKDFQHAMAEFKRRVKKAGIMEDVRKKEYYMKPSVKKKLKRLEAKRRQKREERQNERRTDSTDY